MLAALTRRLSFFHRTREQAAFLDSLPRMQFTSDEQLITNVRAIYEKRVQVYPCRNFSKIARPFQMWPPGSRTTCWRIPSAQSPIFNAFTNWRKCVWWPFPSGTTCIASITVSSAMLKTSAISTFKSICGSSSMRAASRGSFSEKLQIYTHWRCSKSTSTWIPSKICPLGSPMFALPPCSSFWDIKSLLTADSALKKHWTEWPTNTILLSAVFSLQRKCLHFIVSTSTMFPIWPICAMNTCWKMFPNTTVTCSEWSSWSWSSNMKEYWT